MNHQPFEEWLLDDKILTPVEKRELDVHLRTCTHCTALAETGLALRSARAVRPAAGFGLRFQRRLSAQNGAERRRRSWGVILLMLVGGGLSGWILSPYVEAFILSPVVWLSTGISYFLYLATSVQAFGEALIVLAHIMPSFIPPYLWMILLSALAGFGLLGSVSIWRFTRLPQGATS